MRVELPAAAPPSDVPDWVLVAPRRAKRAGVLGLMRARCAVGPGAVGAHGAGEMPAVLSGLEGLQLKRLLRQYATTKRYRFARDSHAALVPADVPRRARWCRDVAGRRRSRAPPAAAPSPPARRWLAAAPPRRRLLRAAPRRRPPPVPAAVAPLGRLGRQERSRWRT